MAIVGFGFGHVYVGFVGWLAMLWGLVSLGLGFGLGILWFGWVCCVPCCFGCGIGDLCGLVVE